MALSTSMGIGQYVASETHIGCTGRYTKGGLKRAVTIHGGRGQSALGNMPPDSITRALAETGAPVMYFDCVDGKQWGNDTSQTRAGQLWTLAKNNFGAKTDKLCLYGSSMGGLVMLNWARANPTLVACVALVIPAIDIGDIYDNNRTASLGFTASADIDAAYGGSAAFASARTAHNPAQNTGGYSGLSMKIWYSGDDPVCIPSLTTTFATAVGAAAVNMGNLGHASSATFAGDVLQFLGQYA